MSETTQKIDPCKTSLAENILESLNEISPDGKLNLTAPDIFKMIATPPDTKMGDYAFPCFRFAKQLKISPPDIATKLCEGVAKYEWVESAAPEKAFANIRINKDMLADSLIKPVIEGEYFERLEKFGGNSDQKVMVEYSQPNTHKEFHVGHARNVILGNCLCRLFKYSGYDTIGSNYFGDEGTHIATALWYINKHNETAPETKRGEWLGEMYVSSKRALADASDDEKKTMHTEIGEILSGIESKTGEHYDLWRETRQWSLDDFDEIYKWLNVKFDKLFYESDVSENAQKIVDEYLNKGVFKEDDGAIGIDLKKYKLGFMIVRKRDGNTIYATKDLELARVKFDEYNIDRSIYVVADEQNHHFKQVFKTLELMGFKQSSKCFHLGYGLVMLPEGKMSSRDGTSITFNSLKDEMLGELDKILAKYKGDWPDEEIEETRHRLCEGAIKYGMLAADPVKKLVFELNNWLSFEGNTGPYLMYSYTRTQSILRKIENLDTLKADLKQLKKPCEHELMRFIYDFNTVVQTACESYRPSTLANHLFFMCKAFNHFYADVPVIKAETKELLEARAALIDSFGKALYKGLQLLGITPPERM